MRTEYAHLQRIGTLSGTVITERRALLETILSEGHIRSELVEQFGVKSLASHTSYVSLLFYLGMLTRGTAPRSSMGYDLEIPNRVIRELPWGPWSGASSGEAVRKKKATRRARS